jgi:hypothetical protein
VREAERVGVPIRSKTGPNPVIRSPYTTNALTAIVWNDLLGETIHPVTRAEAMAVPAMSRSRHILCGFGARAPLRVYDQEEELDPQPAWTYRTDKTTMLPPFHRMLWTIDDLLFSGWCMWAVGRSDERRGDELPGVVLDCARVPIDWWDFDDDGTVQIHDREIPYDDVILIPGPHEGVLNFAAGSLRHASRLLRASTIAAETPIPNVELHDVGDKQLTDDEIDTLIGRWSAARQGSNGGVAYTSRGIEAKMHGERNAPLLIDGRNAAAVDIARHASLPAASIDATLDKSSLTYETTEGRNGLVIDYGVQLYLDAIAARLSMDDVVPRGQRVGFDLETITGLDIPGATPSSED